MSTNKVWIIIFILWTFIFCISIGYVDIWYFRVMWCLLCAVNGFIIGVGMMGVPE